MPQISRRKGASICSKVRPVRGVPPILRMCRIPSFGPEVIGTSSPPFSGLCYIGRWGLYGLFYVQWKQTKKPAYGVRWRSYIKEKNLNLPFFSEKCIGERGIRILNAFGIPRWRRPLAIRYADCRAPKADSTSSIQNSDSPLRHTLP